MTRYIRIAVQSDLSDAAYADLANTVWMLLRNTPHNFHVEHDGKTSIAALNEAWAEYGTDARWD